MIDQKKKRYEFIDFVPGHSVALLSKEKLGPIFFLGDSHMTKGMIGRAKKMCYQTKGGA
jgi:hypothetical protein